MTKFIIFNVYDAQGHTITRRQNIDHIACYEPSTLDESENLTLIHTKGDDMFYVKHTPREIDEAMMLNQHLGEFFIHIK